MRIAVMSVLVHLAIASIAAAQPALTPPAAPVTQQPVAPEVDEKSPTTAVLLSLGITTAGYITLGAADSSAMRWVGAAGVFFGPSTGQWYAGQLGGIGMGARAIGIVSAGYGFAKMLDSETDCIDSDPGCADERARAKSSGNVGAIFFFAGASLWVGSTIADVVFAKQAADHYNARHAMNLSPVVLGDAGHRMPGLVLTGRF
ncbi:MAG TPA: hypothetical protein VLB44_20380 [Kofleriaceae bacterium]|nr:hypothetical protein [Kofleriaceae bacterium]